MKLVWDLLFFFFALKNSAVFGGIADLLQYVKQLVLFIVCLFVCNRLIQV